MAIASIGFAFIAGVLSSLSPCVLPILPLVLGAAVTEHKWGPVALAAGLALSFTIVGLFVAMIGFSIGLDAGVFRNIAAVILIGFGVVMLVPRLRERFAVAASGVSTWASDRTVGYAAHGLTGQLLLGVLLGTVWSPCVGPTLARWSSRCWLSGPAPPCRSCCWGLSRVKPLRDGAIGSLVRESAANLRWASSLGLRVW